MAARQRLVRMIALIAAITFIAGCGARPVESPAASGNPVPPPAGPFLPASAGVPFPVPASLGRLADKYETYGWAGYVLKPNQSSPSANHGHFHYVQAYYEVPAISVEECSQDPAATVAVWVGLDSDHSVQQDGVVATCKGYGGIWEMECDCPGGEPHGLDYVNPGDEMFSSVAYDEDTRNYTFVVKDVTLNLWMTSSLSEQACAALDGCANETAEVITEAPSDSPTGVQRDPFANFRTSRYWGIVVKDSAGEYGSITSMKADDGSMQTAHWDNERDIYASEAAQGDLTNVTIYASPSATLDNGQAFEVSWNASNVGYQPPPPFTSFGCNWSSPGGVPAATDASGGIRFPFETALPSCEISTSPSLGKRLPGQIVVRTVVGQSEPRSFTEMNPDGTNLRQLSMSGLLCCSASGLSRDGQELLVVGEGSLGYLIAGTDDRVLESSPVGSYFEPAWSPNSDQIAYVYTERGPEIDIINTAATTRRVVLRSQDVGYAGGLAWSPDGRQLAFVTSSEAIDLVNLSDGATRTIFKSGLDGTITGLSWSPGPDILFATKDGPGLQAIDVTTGDVRTVLPGAGYSSPSWAPDGIHFLTIRAGRVLVATVDGGIEMAVGPEGVDYAQWGGPNAPE